ncbi:hypothetical protein C7M61_002424 [Candidozyma pseudohaemuli]|uniref:Uncharacterized protein n=1 Tax=Candidozyma pseudohaemuli TaxID=418784 RepID=A0A2P7YT38_9ASCO|nr:hypothetical protein C7M61_002424 [[Candida] pseudohaemulonii]PSK39111.1 hypothetical protein C7M61_002424 [[Candida] pseudohaemulonii]
MVSPTILDKRASSSLSSLESSDPCKHSNSNSCEKPVSTTGLEVGLGIGIPVAVVFAALGLLMWWRYRKNKKESLEHDPDFDENGDATALPDFLPYAKEDPFDNRFSVRPHSKHMDSASNHKTTEIGSISTRNAGDDTPVDGFVLPYHHNTLSKASLEEFARHLVDHRVSTFRGSLLRYNPTTPGESTNTLPQKLSLRYEQETVAEKETPVGKLTKEDYKNLPNHSVASLSANEYFNTKEEVSDDTNDTSKLSDHDFTVEYENEDDLPINQSLSAHASPRKRQDNATTSSDDFADASDSRGPFLEKNHDEPVDTRNIISDEHEEPETASREAEETEHEDEPEQHESEHEDEEPRQVAPAIFVRSPFEEQNETFETEEPTQNTTYDASHDDTSEQPSLVPTPDTSMDPKTHISRSPRLSAFDLIKNVSDDEGEGDTQEREDLDPEQAEELARMKSVYKVYFDRSNSTRTNATVGEDGAFQADASQPLPKIDIDHLQINDQLKGDTQYDKRKTTTSSIYDEAPIFAEDAQQPQQYNMPHQQFLLHPYAQLPAQQFQPPPPAELPPLKSLPSASEIRRSTIETFTDYQPRGKGRAHPLGDSSAGSSPQLTQNGSFATLRSPTSEMPPTIREEGGPTPSPHQLQRTSVSLMNPVDEFKSQRKFKPAGSLPRQPSQPNYMNDYQQSHDDLIPGNRKSAVRRMMNTNF